MAELGDRGRDPSQAPRFVTPNGHLRCRYQEVQAPEAWTFSNDGRRVDLDSNSPSPDWEFQIGVTFFRAHRQKDSVALS
jgi:hypothetical protein